MSLIIDVGCYQTKFGHSDENSPKIISTTISGENQEVEYLVDSNGQLVSEKVGEFLENVFGMDERIEYPVVMSENPSWEKKLAYKNMFEILFEKFHFPSVNIVNEAELIMLENSRTNGCI